MHCCKSTTTVTSQLQWQSNYCDITVDRVYCESNLQFDNNLSIYQPPLPNKQRKHNGIFINK